MKKFILILFSVILSISIYGCSETSKYKTKGFSIEASSDYNKFKHEDYELYLEDDNSFICVFKETKKTINESNIYDFDSVTLERYIELFYTNNNIGECEIENQEGLSYIQYVLNRTEKEYYFRIYFFKTTTAFWACQFCCYESVRSEYEPLFIEWSKTIEV